MQDPLDQIAQAFKKIEQRMQDEKREAKRQVELEKFKERQALEERLRKRQEKIIYGLVFVFLCGMSYLIYIANESGMIDRFVNIFKSVKLMEASVDCSDANNWKLPACLEERKQQVNEKWKGMFFNKHKERPFSIGKEPKQVEPPK